MDWSTQPWVTAAATLVAACAAILVGTWANGWEKRQRDAAKTELEIAKLELELHKLARDLNGQDEKVDMRNATRLTASAAERMIWVLDKVARRLRTFYRWAGVCLVIVIVSNAYLMDTRDRLGNAALWPFSDGLKVWERLAIVGWALGTPVVLVAGALFIYQIRYTVRLHEKEGKLRRVSDSGDEPGNS